MTGKLYILKLRAEPRGPDHLGRPAVYRLRQFLKIALRQFGLRAVEVREDVTDDGAVKNPINRRNDQ